MRTLAVLILSNIAWSQSDAKAAQWLQQTAALLKQTRNCSIQFSYRYLDFKKNIERESDGQLLWDGQKYLLHFMGTTKLYDGQWLYTIIPDDEEVLISKPKSVQGEQLQPAQLLRLFDQKCWVYWDIEQNIQGKKIQYLKLKPKDEADPRKEILLGLNRANKRLYNVIEVRRDGARTTLTIQQWKNQQQWPKDQFRFNKAQYPGYYIHQIR